MIRDYRIKILFGPSITITKPERNLSVPYLLLNTPKRAYQKNMGEGIKFGEVKK